MKDVLEIVADLLLFHVEGAEAFDARRVNDVATDPLCRRPSPHPPYREGVESQAKRKIML